MRLSRNINVLFLLIATIFLSHNSLSLAFDSRVSPEPRRAEVLFLGHASEHHNSRLYAPWLATALFASGINITYTEKLEDLNKNNLAKYDGLVIYANHDVLSKEQEAAMKNFVESGKGLIPLHSAAGCFKNSDWYIETIGGQFESHGEGEFTAESISSDHAIMQGFMPFATWDETYVHQRINPDMTVLMERVEGDHREPYTWVRNVGKGRVFYTAYGHDERTWKNAGFLALVKNGIFWAMGDEVKANVVALNIPDVSIYEETISDFTQRYEVPKIQDPLDPEESKKLIQKPVDFSIELFASEPDIQNPIAMAWDERGRLWIVESVDYPNTFKETDGQANDRIKICEDTNGDGKADKFTVFADGLNIPTSMVFANGGVIVSMAPDFVFMKDTDGDDVADVKEVIMTGWGKNDTHAGPSNLQYGFDNKIWGVTGYSGFNGTINGEQMSFPQGIYRLDPDGKNFEYLAGSSNNTWGLGFSEDNNVFMSTANNTHAGYYSIPAKYLQRIFPKAAAGEIAPEFEIQSIQKIDGHYDAHAMTPNLRQVDVVGGFTSAAGFKLYTARDFPKEYWNRIAFVSEPTIRLTHNAIIEPSGAGFMEKDGWNLLASSDEWFGPVQAEVGPDGAVWIADWYNFIIQHNVFVERQAPSRMVLPFEDQPHGQGNAFQSKLRDTNHGRIYRVVYKDGNKGKAIKLSKDDPKALIAALKNDNMFWRMTAQRLLVESGNQQVFGELYKIVNDKSVDEIGFNSPAVHALWTLHGLGAFEGKNAEAIKVATEALSHPASGVRKAAIAVLANDQASTQVIKSAGLTKDKNLNVRMHAILKLAELPGNAEGGKMLYEASLDAVNAKDDWLQKAIFAAAAEQGKFFIDAIGTEKTDLTNRLISAVKDEKYELGRRSTLQYSPEVKGKAISISTQISQRRDEEPFGVIIAHGDSHNGYSLYLEAGKLHWIVIQNGKSYKAATDTTLPESYEVQASLAQDGKMEILVDGKSVATAKASGAFNGNLSPSVRSGRDFGGNRNVGVYKDEFSFEGNLRNILLELK
ncbi:putative membrane-bound dehydrogenase-like protein [Algoriphagus sp. 4150]|uniref:PVC-type heme-binding CxxCH protein n=1 Tax=Algoriphagus sp. 4150 TaxID=2817756 RepID=UPI00285D5749|nr:PVC-type heme-binding CxxCH protein [Algoriphagus sp. 4150]MDR7128624.1 putative membrane-bound dehydrogenase-like protein [Algoriphagus sp. 4150]